MIFRPHLAAKVLAGEKSVTRRLCSHNPQSPWWIERCRYTVGKEFTVNPGRGVLRVCSARVTSCERMVLGHLSEPEARLEGCDTVEAFETLFAGINATYDPTARVWRVAFELIAAVA